MNVRRLLLAALVLAAAALPAGLHAAPDGPGITTTVDLAKGWKAEAVLMADVDGDGADDLVLAASRRRPRSVRRVSIHLRRDGRASFGPTPDKEYELTSDVVAIATGDVEPGAGAEVVLLTPTGAFAWSPMAGPDARPRRLVRADVLWQGADPHDVLTWQHGVADLNADGLDDLLLPEPDGYRAALQSRKDGASSFHAHRLGLPDALDTPLPETRGSRRLRGRERGRKWRIALNLGKDARLGDGDLFSITDAVPAPVLIDFDGDGDLDVLAQTQDELLVWKCAGSGFPLVADHVERLPLDVDRGRRLDVSFSSQAAQLDRDRKADAVIVAGDRKSEDARSQILVYRQAEKEAGRLFAEDGLPGQALLVAGFAGEPQITDVNGDGSVDLVLTSVDVDGIDAIRAATSGKIDARISVFLGRNGQISRRPQASITLPVEAKEIRRDDRVQARFIGDATGNGASDMLIALGDETLSIRGTVRTRQGVMIRDDAVWSTRVDKRSRVETFTVNGAPELVVVESGRVLHVRFR